MLKIGYLFILLGFFVIWKIHSLQSGMLLWALYLLSLIVLCLGVYLTRMTPYLLVAGLTFVVISLVRFVDVETSRFLVRAGIGLIASSLFVMVIGQFKSPWKGERDIEDRSERENKPLPVLTDAEKLNQPWSTDDKHADWPVAGLMVELCRIAYQPPVEAREELQKRGFESETIESGSMNGYVIKSDETAVILLRGTEGNWHDVLQDLIFISSNSGNGQMHAGFRRGYDESMHRQVNQLLRRFDTKRVWVTGHSLGGALAIVCAHDLIVDGKYQIAGLMTFGQPKVIRQDMKEVLEPKLADRYVFFVNDMDPVVKAVEPYCHFGHGIWYRDGQIERSRKVRAFAAGPENAAPHHPAEIVVPPKIDSFTEEQLADYIKQLQGENKPVTTPDGKPVYQAFLPTVSDHYLDSYRKMIEFLIGKGSNSTQP